MSKIRKSAKGELDLERMKKALNSELIKAPKGLTKEQIRRFILSHAKT